jgi:MOSC domain-containing protein YiiM
LVSLNVGLPKPLAYRGKHVPSGFRKSPVSGSVWLDKTNLQGDAQADLKNHGGPEKAVCVYPLEYYPYWEGRLGRTLGAAAFGENFSAEGLLEPGVCIGDVYRVGEPGRGALVQVSQSCFKQAARYRVKELALWTQETGFYFRVLEEGKVRADDEISLLERTAPEASVAEGNRVMHLDKHDVAGIERLLAVSELSANWRRAFEKRLSGHTEDTAPWLKGLADRHRDRIGVGER